MPTTTQGAFIAGLATGSTVTCILHLLYHSLAYYLASRTKRTPSAIDLEMAKLQHPSPPPTTTTTSSSTAAAAVRGARRSYLYNRFRAAKAEESSPAPAAEPHNTSRRARGNSSHMEPVEEITMTIPAPVARGHVRRGEPS